MSALLWRLADRVYPETHCGFRAKHSAFDMVFSLGQLYVAFINPTKAFNLVSCDGLFFFTKIGCPPKLLSVTVTRVVQFDGATLGALTICSGVKQGCVLSPTLFGIFFAIMLKHAFGTSVEGVFVRTRSDGKLFNLSRLRTKTKVRQTIIRDLLFASDVALASCPGQQLQKLMDRFSH